MAKLLEAAVDKRLMADVRIGCLLSGMSVGTSTSVEDRFQRNLFVV